MLQIFIIVFLALPFAYDSSTAVRYYARFFVYYGYVMVAAIVMIPIMMCRPRDVRNLLWASAVCRYASRLIGLRWRVVNADILKDKESCVIVANHQSSLDILGMFEMWHEMGLVTVVAKRELLFAGPFGLAAWLCDLIFIDRSDTAASRDVINTAVNLMLPNKTKLWVFPEGTRRNTGTIHPFKKGAFHVAVTHQLPIVPVVYSQYYFLDNDSTIFYPGDATLTVLPAIETKGLTQTDVESLIEKVHKDMLDVFKLSTPELPVTSNFTSS